MKKYYIEHACGNFSAPLEYSKKPKEDILNDLRSDCLEYMTIAEFASQDEAEKAYKKYHSDITIINSDATAMINYDIYNLTDK